MTDHDRWNDVFALGDEADPGDQAWAKEHLKTCDECQTVEEGFGLFKQALLDDKDEVDDPEVREQVLAAAQAQFDGAVRAHRAKRLAFMVTLALVLLVVGTVVWRWSRKAEDPVDRRLDEAEEQLTHGDFPGAIQKADAVLGLPDATGLEKERARRIKERAR